MIVKYKLGISASLLCGLQVGQLISLCNSMKLMIQNHTKIKTGFRKAMLWSPALFIPEGSGIILLELCRKG